MNNSESIKKCPFCKNQIPADSEKCPICKMILIERFETIKKNAEEIKEEPLYQKKLSSNSIKKLFINIYNLFKRKKWAIITTFLIVLVIFYVYDIYKSNNSERILNNSDLKNNTDFKDESVTYQGKNSNPSNNNDPLQINKQKFEYRIDTPIYKDQEIQDFSKIPEKYIANGKISKRNKRFFYGLGELTIKNGTSNDAVTKLVSTSTRKSILTIYIRRNSNFTIKKISDGNYKLYFVVGRHYDKDTNIFLQDCSFSVFEDDFFFTTQEYHLTDKIKTEYSVFEITLHPVIGGSAKTVKITKYEFLSL